eukprot:CAMPEP_0119144090 /NCGR_PEP_ID=MMETSP1310-20130426/35326_1 /TAXON_ID=464262 /ORGANISM="Genus nov. species nov., Strain RCC2339" /LENGTH=63 /DNA_ID=CAMNT_0007135779 /DNA_START=89 /DNA_END=277 /DNA_ORIENTATION=+
MWYLEKRGNNKQFSKGKSEQELRRRGMRLYHAVVLTELIREEEAETVVVNLGISNSELDHLRD